MKQIVAIIGKPGVGKSTLVRSFLGMGLQDWEYGQLQGLLWGHRSPSRGLTVLGDYRDPDEKYPGCNRLSMGVPPGALWWMTRVTADSVLFEGDRLGCHSTLRPLTLVPEMRLRILHLTAPNDVLRMRLIRRGGDQKEGVLRARATKISNMLCNPNLAPHIVNRDTTGSPGDLACEVDAMLRARA